MNDLVDVVEEIGLSTNRVAKSAEELNDTASIA